MYVSVQNKYLILLILFLSVGPGAYLIFVADAANIVRGELLVMWRNFIYREILDVEKFEM